MKDKTELFKIVREREQSVVHTSKLLLIENKDYELLSKVLFLMIQGPIYYLSIGLIMLLSLFSQWFFIRQFSLLFIAFFLSLFFLMLLIEHEGKKLYFNAEVLFMTPHKRKVLENNYTLTKIEGWTLAIWKIIFITGLFPFFIGLIIVDGSWATAIFFGFFGAVRLIYDIFDNTFHPHQTSFSKNYYSKYKILFAPPD